MQKRLIVLLILLGLVALGLGIVVQERGIRVRGWVDATMTGALPYRVPIMGVNADLTHYEGDELDRQLVAMRAAGFYWVRQAFPWAEIEPARGAFEWAKWDRIVESAARMNDMEIMAVLDGPTPEWARTSDHAYAPPQDNADFARFAEAFAARYGDSISVYQIWDMPNAASHWGGLSPDPAAYIDLLRGAYEGLHQVDEDAFVLAAGLGGKGSEISDAAYLEAMYAHGGSDAFDAAAAELDGYEISPDDRRVSEDVFNFSRAVLLREIMLENGDAHKALWGTAFGSTVENPVIRSQHFTVAYARAVVEWPWMGGLILKGWDTKLAEVEDPQIALFGSWLPHVISAISGENSGRWLIPGRHALAAPAITYEGEWQIGGSGAKPESPGAAFSFMFWGDRLAFEVYRAKDAGEFHIRVNGQPAGQLPTSDDGRSGILNAQADTEGPYTEIVAVSQEEEHSYHGIPIHPRVDVKVEGGLGSGGVSALAVGIFPDTLFYDVLLLILSVVAFYLLFGLYSSLKNMRNR